MHRQEGPRECPVVQEHIPSLESKSSKICHDLQQNLLQSIPTIRAGIPSFSAQSAVWRLGWSPGKVCWSQALKHTGKRSISKNSRRACWCWLWGTWWASGRPQGSVLRIKFQTHTVQTQSSGIQKWCPFLVCPSIRRSVCLSVCVRPASCQRPSISLSVSLSVRLSVRLSIGLSISLFVCLCVRPSVRLSVYMCLCVCVHMSSLPTPCIFVFKISWIAAPTFYCLAPRDSESWPPPLRGVVGCAGAGVLRSCIWALGCYGSWAQVYLCKIDTANPPGTHILPLQNWSNQHTPDQAQYDAHVKQ